MPRIKLREQSVYEFHFDVVIQPRDVNYSGHLGHDALISLVHCARADLFRSLGVSEMDLGDGRTAIIMSDLAVNYRGEGFMFEPVRIESHVDEVTRNGFRLFHRLIKDGQVLALVETGLLAYDYPQRKIVHVPQAFIEALARISPKET